MKLVKLSEFFDCFFRKIVKGGRNTADFFQLVQKKLNWIKSIWAQETILTGSKMTCEN